MSVVSVAHSSPGLKTFVLPFAGDGGKVLSEELAGFLLRSDDIEVWDEKNPPLPKNGKYGRDFLYVLQRAGFTEEIVIGGNVSPTSVPGDIIMELFVYNLSLSNVEYFFSSPVPRERAGESIGNLADEVARRLTGQSLFPEKYRTAEARWRYLGTQEFQKKRRNMLFPALISIIIPGSGHIYTGEYVKGGILFSAAIGSLILMGGGEKTHNGTSTLNTQGVIGFIGWFGITLYASLDSMVSANRHNRRLLEKIDISIGPDATVSITERF